MHISYTVIILLQWKEFYFEQFSILMQIFVYVIGFFAIFVINVWNVMWLMDVQKKTTPINNETLKKFGKTTKLWPFPS